MINDNLMTIYLNNEQKGWYICTIYYQDRFAVYATLFFFFFSFLNKKYSPIACYNYTQRMHNQQYKLNNNNNRKGRRRAHLFGTIMGIICLINEEHII